MQPSLGFDDRPPYWREHYIVNNRKAHLPQPAAPATGRRHPRTHPARVRRVGGPTDLPGRVDTPTRAGCRRLAANHLTLLPHQTRPVRGLGHLAVRARHGRPGSAHTRRTGRGATHHLSARPRARERSEEHTSEL